MNKGELVDAVAEKTSMKRADATTAIDAVFSAISDSLAKGDEVKIAGFGNFAITERKASMGRNPQTGEAMQIKASKQAKFRPGKSLKDSLNGPAGSATRKAPPKGAAPKKK